MSKKKGILKNAKSIAAVSQYWFELIMDTTKTNYVTNDSTLADTTTLVSGLQYLTNYWWRVRAMNQTGWGAYTNWSKFTTVIDTPNVVQQVSPLNGSVGNIQPVQLNWKSSARAGNYRLQFSTDSTFATSTIDTLGLTDTAFTVSSLNNLTTYYWRVNASNVGGTSAWSSVWNFKTLGNPTQAVLLYPAANSVNIPVTVNFEWNQSQDQLSMARKKGILKNAKSIAAVSQYWFELITDTTKTNYVTNDSTLADTTTLVSGLQYLTNYWWRVRAMNQTGWGAYTNWSKFTTIIDTPGVATLLTPNSNSTIPDTASSILFTWDSASYAGTYELQIASNKNFSPVIIDSIGIIDTVFIYHPKNLISTFSWRVRGNNVAGTGLWSTTMTVSLISGINNIKNGLPLVYELYQNYPNPFNPGTIINYALPFSSNVKIEIYNILGERVRELLNAQRNAGYYSVSFNTAGLSSGVYLYMIEAKSLDGKIVYRDTKKMLLLK
jgi:hypothetical protein